MAHEVRRIVERWESEGATEREWAIADFTFVPGQVYRNEMWSYKVLEVLWGGERIRVRRVDTGQERTLIIDLAAELHIEAEATGGDERGTTEETLGRGWR